MLLTKKFLQSDRFYKLHWSTYIQSVPPFCPNSGDHGIENLEIELAEREAEYWNSRDLGFPHTYITKGMICYDYDLIGECWVGVFETAFNNFLAAYNLKYDLIRCKITDDGVEIEIDFEKHIKPWWKLAYPEHTEEDFLKKAIFWIADPVNWRDMSFDTEFVYAITSTPNMYEIDESEYLTALRENIQEQLEDKIEDIDDYYKNYQIESVIDNSAPWSKSESNSILMTMENGDQYESLEYYMPETKPDIELLSYRFVRKK